MREEKGEEGEEDEAGEGEVEQGLKSPQGDGGGRIEGGDNE